MTIARRSAPLTVPVAARRDGVVVGRRLRLYHSARPIGYRRDLSRVRKSERILAAAFTVNEV